MNKKHLERLVEKHNRDMRSGKKKPVRERLTKIILKCRNCGVFINGFNNSEKRYCDSCNKEIHRLITRRKLWGINIPPESKDKGARRKKIAKLTMKTLNDLGLERWAV